MVDKTKNEDVKNFKNEGLEIQPQGRARHYFENVTPEDMEFKAGGHEIKILKGQKTWSEDRAISNVIRKIMSDRGLATWMAGAGEGDIEAAKRNARQAYLTTVRQDLAFAEAARDKMMEKHPDSLVSKNVKKRVEEAQRRYAEAEKFVNGY